MCRVPAACSPHAVPQASSTPLLDSQAQGDRDPAVAAKGRLDAVGI
ncbi:MAG: hypothetical protein U1F61_21635 [Opitutaceae bacterium]